MTELTPEARESWKREVEMASHTLISFGNVVRTELEDRKAKDPKLSIRRLALRLEMDHVVLSRIIRGEVVANGSYLTKLLDWVYHPENYPPEEE